MDTRKVKLKCKLKTSSSVTLCFTLQQIRDMLILMKFISTNKAMIWMPKMCSQVIPESGRIFQANGLGSAFQSFL